MSAERGDEIFFHHKGQPKSGKVLCVGAHGCTVKSGEEQHKLKWEHIKGHKKRAPQHYKVLEDGEDGMIVQNQHGRRKLLAIPPEAKAEQLELAPQIKKLKAPDA